MLSGALHSYFISNKKGQSSAYESPRPALSPDIEIEPKFPDSSLRKARQ